VQLVNFTRGRYPSTGAVEERGEGESRSPRMPIASEGWLAFTVAGVPSSRPLDSTTGVVTQILFVCGTYSKRSDNGHDVILQRVDPPPPRQYDHDQHKGGT
jgi:hypothetical protein